MQVVVVVVVVGARAAWNGGGVGAAVRVWRLGDVGAADGRVGGGEWSTGGRRWWEWALEWVG